MDVTDGVENQLIRLQDISGFLEADSLDDNLLQLAEKTARILEARHCSIMLLNEGEPENPRMRVCASYGSLAAAAYKESVHKGEGIAGHVIDTGKSLFIENIDESQFANRARRAKDSHKSSIVLADKNRCRDCGGGQCDGLQKRKIVQAS